jgi:hypothetical protein
VITSALHAYEANLNQAHAIVHVLDDLEGGIDAGCFGDRLHEGIVPPIVLEYLEYFLISIVWLFITSP